MPETYLSLILKASKTGTGVTDATREMKDFEKSIESVRKTEVAAAQQHQRMAESLKSNSTLASVTKQSFAGLEKELQAGSLSVAGYQAAMQKAGVGAGLVSQASLNASTSIQKLNADYAQGKISVEQYAGGLKSVQSELQNSQGFMERYGAAIQTVAVVSLGALALGLANVTQSATQFESSMSVIVGLTNTTKEQIGGLTAEVLKMAPAVGKSPKELSKALYFISSSGYQGAEALKILESSAKASAAGLGETKTIADSVTSALKAYGEGADQASRYTDMFIQIVKEGKGEPEELAAVLGRGLPIAKAAGISFEEMGASIATMTLTGMDSAEAMTSFRGTVGALEAPGKQATDALKGLGLTTDELRQSIREKGLLVALKDLMDRTGGNIETLDLIIPNIRALTGVLSSAGSGAEDYTAILGRMYTETGQTGESFGVAAETMALKAAQVGASFDVIKISLGNMLLPALKSLAETIKGVLDSFTALDPSTQKMIVTFGALALSAAPATMAIHKVIDGAKSLGDQVKNFEAMREGGAGLFKSLSALKTIEFGVIIAGLTVIVSFLAQVSEAAKKSNEDLIAMSRSGDALQQAGAAAEILSNGQTRLYETAKKVGAELSTHAQTYTEYASGALGAAAAAGMLTDEQAKQYVETGKVNKQLIDGTVDVTKQVIEQTGLLTEAQFNARQSSMSAAYGIDILSGSMLGATTASGDMVTATESIGKTAEETATDIANLNTSVATMTAGYGGAVSKEMGDFGTKQDELKAKAADLAKQISDLEAAQGKQVATSSKGALTANEMAAKQAKLAAVTEDLTLQQRKKNETDKEFAARMGNLQVQADKLAGQLSGGTSTAIVDNSEKIADLKVKYDEATGAITANAAAHDEAMKRIVLDIAMQQLAVDGWTEVEIAAFTDVAKEMGVFDQKSADMTAGVLEATGKLARDQNPKSFARDMRYVLQGVDDDTKRTTVLLGSMQDKIDKLQSKTVTVRVITEEDNRSNVPPTHGGPQEGWASGGNFIVPPGYPNDSYPLLVQSGERVIVMTPQQQKDQGFATGTMSQSSYPWYSGYASWQTTPAFQTESIEAGYSGAAAAALLEYRTQQSALSRTTADLTRQMAELNEEEQRNLALLGMSADDMSEMSDEMKALKEEYDATTKAINENTAAHDEAMKKIVLDIAQQQLATDGWAEAEIWAFAEVARNMGMFDETSANLTKNVLKATATLAKDGNIAVFNEKLQRAFKDVSSSSISGGAQFGGQISRPTWVGEAGPELFFPQGRGYVMDNADSMRLIRALEALAARSGTETGASSNAYNLTVNTPSAANVLRDFAMLQALAGG